LGSQEEGCLVLRLSPREAQVVMLIGRHGLTYGEAASHLDISGRTVESYVGRILQRYPSQKRPRAAITEMYYHHYHEEEVIESEGASPGRATTD
jgi:DNA-directed RNA polymerase specialized sigma24 family protein|tara:strand:+ start:3132 stop:3413 length:282 start_codon:yes stop_codon:yes gene_type:complete